MIFNLKTRTLKNETNGKILMYVDFFVENPIYLGIFIYSEKYISSLKK